MFVIESEKDKYFDSETPVFGQDVQDKFISTTFEIDEAAKCFALSRSTACVFHLMRAMEIVIRALARCLSIPDPTKPAQRNWGFILKSFKDEIDDRNVARPSRWSNADDRQFFDDAYASIDVVRNAWRNTTMHVERKYTDDEAEGVLIAVQVFMKKIASRLDEGGQPLA